MLCTQSWLGRIFACILHQFSIRSFDSLKAALIFSQEKANGSNLKNWFNIKHLQAVPHQILLAKLPLISGKKPRRNYFQDNKNHCILPQWNLTALEMVFRHGALTKIGLRPIRGLGEMQGKVGTILHFKIKAIGTRNISF